MIGSNTTPAARNPITVPDSLGLPRAACRVAAVVPRGTRVRPTLVILERQSEVVSEQQGQEGDSAVAAAVTPGLSLLDPVLYHDCSN